MENTADDGAMLALHNVRATDVERRGPEAVIHFVCPDGGVGDIASGPGATAHLLVTDHDVTVDGVDLGPSTLERARRVTAEAGLAGKVRFHLGDAERIPLPDSTFNKILEELERQGLTEVRYAAIGLVAPAELLTIAGTPRPC